MFYQIPIKLAEEIRHSAVFCLMDACVQLIEACNTALQEEVRNNGCIDYKLVQDLSKRMEFVASEMSHVIYRYNMNFEIMCKNIESKTRKYKVQKNDE